MARYAFIRGRRLAMITRLRAILFPDPDRSFSGERALRTSLRTVHIASMGVLLGGHFFDVPAESLRPALRWTVASGASFAALELYGSFHWLFQVRGLITLGKLILILTVPFLWEFRVHILMAVLTVGSVGSHMTAGLRYYSVLTGQHRTDKRG